MRYSDLDSGRAARIFDGNVTDSLTLRLYNFSQQVELTIVD